MAMRLLLVEDDRRLSDLLLKGLRSRGYAVDPAGTAEDARWLALENPYDALVVDIGLPDGDGIDLSADLRSNGAWYPILLLTARQAIRERVRGLDAGADDYLVKPFAFEELLARLRALLRRGAPERPATLTAGSLTLDPARRSVSVAGAALPLTTREFALLELLVRRRDEVVARSDIIEHVWDWAYDGTSNVVDVYVAYLRAHLRRHPSAPVIETVRGVGYRLTANAP